MRRRFLSAVAAAVSAVTLAGLLAGPVPAATAAPKGAAKAPSTKPAARAATFALAGSIAAVDPAAGTVSVTAGAATTTVTVAATATIVLDEAAATLADLPAGARVRVTGTTTGGVRTATKVTAASTWFFETSGTLDALDADAATVTVSHTSGNGTTRTTTVPVDGAAVITLDGAAVTLADLPAGARIEVTGTVTNGVPAATGLTAVSSWRFTLSGTVVAADGVLSTLTVRRSAGTTTVTVDAAATVRLNRVAVALGALPTGATVKVTGTGSVAGTTVTTVEAHAPKKAPAKRKGR
jgi:hypothetical protein